MTTAQIPADALERAGLSPAAVAEWAASAPGPGLSFRAAADAVGVFLDPGHESDPAPARPGPGHADERAARAAIAETMNEARETFLRAHAEDLYDALTDRCTKPLRLAELLRDAAVAVPGLVPTSAQLDAERTRMLPDKEGIELAQGLLVGYVLAVPRTGRHLITAMLRPVPEAFERLGELRARGTVDLGPVRVTRRGRAGLLELVNPRHLNAEDDVTLAPTECAVDMILLDPDIEVGVIRGGPVDHPRYPGTRVFGSGLNLTRLYHGRIDFLFFLERDLGYVHKIYRGITGARGARTRGRRSGPRRSCGSPRWSAWRSAAPASCCTWSTTSSPPAGRGCSCRPARRGSSRARPTCGSPGSSATAPPGRRSCPAGSGSRASRTPRCSAMRWWNPARWTGRSRPGSTRSPTRGW